jgi:hypothetical protein
MISAFGLFHPPTKCISGTYSQILLQSELLVFQVGDLEVTRLTYHNPKKINWEAYREDLKVNLGVVSRGIHLMWDVELAADMLQ